MHWFHLNQRKNLHLKEGAAINPTKLEKAIKTMKQLRENKTHLQKLLQKRLPVVLVPKTKNL